MTAFSCWWRSTNWWLWTCAILSCSNAKGTRQIRPALQPLYLKWLYSSELKWTCTKNVYSLAIIPQLTQAQFVCNNSCNFFYKFHKHTNTQIHNSSDNGHDEEERKGKMVRMRMRWMVQTGWFREAASSDLSFSSSVLYLYHRLRGRWESQQAFLLRSAKKPKDSIIYDIWCYKYFIFIYSW